MIVDKELGKRVVALADEIQHLPYNEEMNALIFFLERAANRKDTRQIQWQLSAVLGQGKGNEHTGSEVL